MFLLVSFLSILSTTLFLLTKQSCPRTYQILNFCHTPTRIWPSKPIWNCSSSHQYLWCLKHCHIFCVYCLCRTWKVCGVFFPSCYSAFVYKSISSLITADLSFICWYLWDLTLKRCLLRVECLACWWAASDTVHCSRRVWPAKLFSLFFLLSLDSLSYTLYFLCVFSVPACCLEYSKWSIILIEFNSIKDTFVEKVNFQSSLNNTKEDLTGS